MAPPLLKCVSLGNAGGPGNPAGGSPIADLWSHNNNYYLLNTQTPWVRLFVEWNWAWPKAPAPPDATSPTPFPAPADYATNVIEHLDRSIRLAKHPPIDKKTKKRPPRKVILTTLESPLWVNGADQTDPRFGGRPVEAYSVCPPDSALGPSVGKPPDGVSYRPWDLMYSQWLTFLITRYHPANPYQPGVFIDALEIVNEPNLHLWANSYSARDNGTTSLDEATAFMMITAQGLNTFYNGQFGPPYLNLLAPATAANINTNIAQPGHGIDYRAFTKGLIYNLTQPHPFGSHTYTFNHTDPRFGWSHHNYEDITAFKHLIGFSTNAAIWRALFETTPSMVDAAYGKRTQTVRNLLRSAGASTGGTTGPSWWRGWGQQTQPRLWLTEGGSLLENTFQGQVNGSHSTGAKLQQQIELGLACDVLKRKQPGEPGEGVEMLTQFLFYDEPPMTDFFPGLCNPFDATKSAQAEEHPAYKSWKQFAL